MASAGFHGINPPVKVNLLLLIFSQTSLNISEYYHQAWCCTSVISVQDLGGRGRRIAPRFKASLVYIKDSRAAKPVLRLENF